MKRVLKQKGTFVAAIVACLGFYFLGVGAADTAPVAGCTLIHDRHAVAEWAI